MPPAVFSLLLALPWWGFGASLPDPEPPGRGAAAVVGDPVRGVLVVFGGIGAAPRAFGDLWELSRERWRSVPSSPAAPAPSPRFNASAAYHAPTGRVVLHGGGGLDESLGDTWGWDGTAWRRLAADGSGPPARTCGRMAAHGPDGDLVLFGGQAADGRMLADTWTWDGARWHRHDVAAPPASCFHALAYDEARGETVLFGGRGAGDETWTWDGASWRRAATDGPPARDHHALGWDPVSRRVVLHGGGGQDAAGTWDGSVLADTWAWDGAAWTRLPDSGPARMHAPGMAAVPALGGLLLFGGSDREASHADVWRFDGERWRAVDASENLAPPPDGPGHRSSHVLTWDQATSSVLMLGGLGRPSGVWSWDGEEWRRAGDAAEPGSRAHLAAAGVPGTDEVLVHGGLEAFAGQSAGLDVRFGDTWLRGPDGLWRRVTEHHEGPGVRDHHAAVADPARGEVLLFGGARTTADGTTTLADTWAWRDGAWHLAAADGPPARSTHRMVWDAARDRVVMFGGWGVDGLLNDVWEWDGQRWHDVTPGPVGPAPSPRFAARLAYDAARGVTVLYGGRGADGDLDDTWLWNGASWARMDVSGPGARNVHAMAYDPVRRVVVLHGGFHAPERFTDTWTWDGEGWTRVRP